MVIYSEKNTSMDICRKIEVFQIFKEVNRSKYEYLLRKQ